MKFNHNKKRNTAFIYEALVGHLSKVTLHRQEEDKRATLSIMKEFFSKGRVLRRDLEIYTSLSTSSGEYSKDLCEKILTEAKRQFLHLDRDVIFKEQTRIINRINKSFGKEVWSNYLPSYRDMATINQVLVQNLSPKKQVVAEQRLMELMLQQKEEKSSFPKVNNLTLKTFIEKFNSEYSETLDENQKNLLNRYIMSYMEDGLEFKAFLYEEIDSLKKTLTENVDSNKKIDKILKRMDGYSDKKLDNSFIYEVMQIQSLVQELNNNATNN
jgi:hypothetical protein